MGILRGASMLGGVSPCTAAEAAPQGFRALAARPLGLAASVQQESRTHAKAQGWLLAPQQHAIIAGQLPVQASLLRA